MSRPLIFTSFIMLFVVYQLVRNDAHPVNRMIAWATLVTMIILSVIAFVSSFYIPP